MSRNVVFVRLTKLEHYPNRVVKTLIGALTSLGGILDFIEGLPNSHEHTVILVVIDKFLKYSHFLTLSHPYTAQKVAQVLFDKVFKLHGIPKSITFDRDPIFLSNFGRLSLDYKGLV